MPDGKFHISFDKKRLLEWAAILGFGGVTGYNTIVGGQSDPHAHAVPDNIDKRLEVIEKELTRQGSEDYHLHKRVSELEEIEGLDRWRRH